MNEGFGAGINDLNSTQKGGVQLLSALAASIQQGVRPATASSSPVFTGVNTLGTTATTVVGPSTIRHGIMFHNPGTTTEYFFGSTLGTTPSTAVLGGVITLSAGSTVVFPSVQFQNVNCGFLAFAASGTSNPLTIVEFL